MDRDVHGGMSYVWWTNINFLQGDDLDMHKGWISRILLGRVGDGKETYFWQDYWVVWNLYLLSFQGIALWLWKMRLR